MIQSALNSNSLKSDDRLANDESIISEQESEKQIERLEKLEDKIDEWRKD